MSLPALKFQCSKLINVEKLPAVHIINNSSHAVVGLSNPFLFLLVRKNSNLKYSTMILNVFLSKRKYFCYSQSLRIIFLYYPLE